MGVERLGRYVVLKHLASGGMADVLLGRSDGIEGFERHVVLKRIRAEHAKDQRFIQMFLDEARTAAGLHHANIVQVHDIGESRGEFFFAMEYIHGEDLRKILSAVSKSKAHMPLGYVVAIISAVASGLHHAHERRGNDKKPLNIVHRDVSPSNILVGYDGLVKVVDFGIAKAAMRQVETMSGSLKGKVSYMSPEQCKGEGIDRRSDVYALGVVLYELATTTRLFKGENDYLMMDNIVHGKVPLPQVRRPDLPNELSSIIMRCLSVDAARRYQSADELRVALDQFAIKAGLTASASALATYMHKLFGERPEPWLDGAGDTSVEMPAHIDVDAHTEAAHNSWTELPRDDIAAEGQASRDAKTRTDGKRRSRAVQITRSPIDHDDTVVPISPRDTRTSAKFGFEKQRPATLPAAPRRRAVALLGLVGLPLLAIAGVATWHFWLRDDGAPSPATPVAAVAPPPAPTVTPIPAPAPTPAAPVPAPVVAVAPAPVLAPPPVAQPPAPVVPKAPPSPHRATRPPAIASAPVAAAAVTPAPAPVAPPPAAPAVVAPPTPAPAPEPPKEVEATMAQLSSATVSAVASDHSRELSKCEGTTEVHGDVSVTFQIDATGRVVKSQIASTIKNPKVSACILRAVQSWHFPHPPAGSAKGVYSINYQ